MVLLKKKNLFIVFALSENVEFCYFYQLSFSGNTCPKEQYCYDMIFIMFLIEIKFRCFRAFKAHNKLFLSFQSYHIVLISYLRDEYVNPAVRQQINPREN